MFCFMHYHYTCRVGKPLLVDPANPYNNVADSCNVWDEVARHARYAMDSPLLRQIYGDNWN